MNKLLKFLLLVLIVLIPTCTLVQERDVCDEGVMTEEELWKSQWDDLLVALIQVESSGDSLALGSCEDRGILQITPITIREVNRLTGLNYTHDDAWSVEKSKEMFYIIAEKYCPEGDYEKMARIWNGGPRGHLKETTVAYWARVQKELNKKES